MLFLLRVVACVVVLAFAIGNATAKRPPNIILVLADDLGYGDLSCFGQERFTTPHLDAMAASGMRLTQHYSGSTVCAPSRCALMTGLHTGHCDVRGNREHRPIGQVPMAGSAVTVAELLRGAGYATGAFGKWGLGYPGSEGDPTNQGFDRFYGYNCQRNAHRYFREFLYDGSEQVSLGGEKYTPPLIMDQAVEFIRSHRDQAFFCYLPVTIPHAAMEAPEADIAPFRQQFQQFENTIGSYAGAKTRNPVAAFAAMVTRLDRDMGRIVALLDELGLRDDTLIVFTSDNGPHVEGGHRPKYFRSSGPYRGVKRDLYEGGIRMPTIVSWPGHTPAGSDSDFASAAWDWLPTFCELAGVDPPAGLDGVSLAPTITGMGEQVEHDYLYWEFHEQGGRQAIRRGDWKAIRLDVTRLPDGPVELYNLADDPAEATNVADRHPEIAAQLAAMMEEVRRPSEAFNFHSKTFRANKKKRD